MARDGGPHQTGVTWTPWTSTSRLRRRRQAVGLQLVAASSRAGQARPERAVALRRRLRAIDAEIARRAG